MNIKGFYFSPDDPPGGSTPPATPPATPPENNDVPKSWEDFFKHPRFKELNERAKNAETQLAEIKTKEKETQDAALKEQNKFKELYEGTQKDLAKERLTNLRLKVASSKGLPADLVDRLQGETEDDLNADADKLLTLMKPAEPRKGVPPVGPGGKAPVIDLATETDPAKVREALRNGSAFKTQ